MHKCTLCYDRLQDGLEPACAKACPTDSIQFGPLDELVVKARERCEHLVESGVADARLYLAPDDGDGIGGAGAFFLLLDEPEVYGLPPDPVVPTKNLRTIWGAAAAAAGALAAGALLAFAGGAR
jgi:formate dehydrogenase iron-sulfur subunit